MNIETTYNKKYRDVGFVIGFSLIFGAVSGSFGGAICEIIGVSLYYHWVPSLPLFALLFAMAAHQFAQDIKTKERGRAAAWIILIMKVIAIAGGCVASVLFWLRP